MGAAPVISSLDQSVSQMGILLSFSPGSCSSHLVPGWSTEAGGKGQCSSEESWGQAWGRVGDWNDVDNVADDNAGDDDSGRGDDADAVCGDNADDVDDAGDDDYGDGGDGDVQDDDNNDGDNDNGGNDDGGDD